MKVASIIMLQKKPVGKTITEIRLALGSHLMHHYFSNALALELYAVLFFSNSAIAMSAVMLSIQLPVPSRFLSLAGVISCRSDTGCNFVIWTFENSLNR
jgi:hypothetical protein